MPQVRIIVGVRGNPLSLPCLGIESRGERIEALLCRRRTAPTVRSTQDPSSMHGKS